MGMNKMNNSKLSLLFIIGLIGIFFFVKNVNATGQPDVLTDIRNLVSYYETYQCRDVTNIAYGSFDGCRPNSNITYALNYNAAILLMSYLGVLDNNQTLINYAKDSIDSINYLQNRRGDFAVENITRLQQPTYAPVQNYQLIIALTESYKILSYNMTTQEKNKFIDVLRNYINWLMINPVFIADQGSGIAFDRFEGAYFRKQLNISSSEANLTDNIKIYFRLSSTANTPPPSNISLYFGEDNSTIYNLSTNVINLDLSQGFNELTVNKTQMLNNCILISNNYTCNITFVRKNDVWNSTNSFSLGRTAAIADNVDWSSLNGTSWVLANATPHIIQIKYSPNTTLGGWNNASVDASNQPSARALSCKLAYDVLNGTEYTITTGLAQTCYNNSINGVLNHSKDGIYGELNGLIRLPADNTQYWYHGYAYTYQYLASTWLSRFYQLSGDYATLSSLNGTMNNLSYYIYGNSSNLIRATGFGTRGNVKDAETVSQIIGDSFTYFGALATIAMNSNFTDQGKILNNITLSYNQANPYNTSAWTHPSRMVDVPLTLYYFYNSFNNNTNNGVLNSNQTRYLNNNSAGLFTVGTNNYRAFGSYRNSTSSGGVIGDIHLKSNLQHLFSGTPADAGLNTYGLGSLVTIINNLNYSNNMDVYNSIFTIINSSYPYKLNFIGNLSAANSSKSFFISDITYNTTYTFYDDYIDIQQNINSPVELQLWGISNSTIGNGQIIGLQESGNFYDSANFLPLNFAFSYIDRDDNTSWGTVDKFNASGTNFHYIISTRANSPLWFSQSSNTEKHIANNLTSTLSGLTVVVNVNDCTTVKSLDYTSNSGIQTHYDSSQYTCANNKITVVLNNVEPATNSNILIINGLYSQDASFFCSTLLGGNTFGGLTSKFSVFFGLLSVVILISIVGLIVVGIKNPDGLRNLGSSIFNLGDIIRNLNLSVAFVIAIFIVVLVIFVFIITIAAVCLI